MRKRDFTDSECLQHTAVHEAGHAIMAMHFGFPLGSVSIKSDGHYAGVTEKPEAGEVATKHPDAMLGLEKEIIVLMAGTEAVKAALPNLAGPPWGDSTDLEQIKIRARDLCLFTRETESRAIRRLREMAACYVTALPITMAILEVANELLQSKTKMIGKRRAQKLIRKILEKHHRQHSPGYRRCPRCLLSKHGAMA